jgi:flagellar hook-associated protein 3 FlgL
MQITPTMMMNSFLQGTNNLSQQMMQLEEETTTGQAYQYPSEDPAAIAGTMDLNAIGGQIPAYQSAASSAQDWLNTGSSTLQQVSQLWTNVIQLATEASNSSLTSSDEQAITDQLSEASTTLQELLSTQYNGQPLFNFSSPTSSSSGAGSQSPSQAPSSLVFQIGANQLVTVNLTGSESTLWSTPPATGNIFTQLQSDLQTLASEVSSGASPSTWSVGIGQLNTDNSYISNAESLLGGRLQRVNQQTSYLSNLQTTVTQGVTTLDGANMTEVASQLAQAETAYQAALQTGAQILPLSLLSYLHS